jgi:hypothetical protein
MIKKINNSNSNINNNRERMENVMRKDPSALDCLIMTLEQDLQYCDSYMRGMSDKGYGITVGSLRKYLERKLRCATVVRNIRDRVAGLGKLSPGECND